MSRFAKRKPRTPTRKKDRAADSQPPKPADQPPAKDNQRDKRAQEAALLRKCLFHPNPNFATVLFEKTHEAEKTIKKAQEKYQSSPKLALREFRHLLSKIYDPEHLEFSLETKEAKYSAEFEAYFSLIDEPSDVTEIAESTTTAKIVTPAKPTTSTVKQQQQPSADSKQTSLETVPEAKQQETSSPEQGKDEDSLSTFNADKFISAHNLDEFLAEIDDPPAIDTPRANNLSMTESQIYEQEGVEPLGDVSDDENGNKEEDDDSNADGDIKPTEKSTDQSTISSMEDNEWATANENRSATQQEIDRLRRDFEHWKENFDLRLVAKEDTITWLEEEVTNKQARIVNLEEEVVALKDQLVDQEEDYKRLHEKFVSISGDAIFRAVQIVKKEALEDIKTQMDSINLLRTKLRKELTSMAQIQQKFSQISTKPLNKK